MHIDQLMTHVPPAPPPFTAEEQAMLDLLLNTDEEKAELDKKDKEDAKKCRGNVTNPPSLSTSSVTDPFWQSRPAPGNTDTQSNSEEGKTEHKAKG